MSVTPTPLRRDPVRRPEAQDASAAWQITVVVALITVLSLALVLSAAALSCLS